MWTIAKEFRFEASHQLPKHTGKCARLHGHSWRGELVVVGDALVDGILVDYADISAAIKPLLQNSLDHYHLNESLQLANPTSEEVARWIWDRVEIPGLQAVVIRETCTSRCVYRGTGTPIETETPLEDPLREDAKSYLRKAIASLTKAGSLLTSANGCMNKHTRQHARLKRLRGEGLVFRGRLARFLEGRE